MKKTRKALVAELEAIMRKHEDYVKIIKANPALEEHKKVVVGYDVMEQGEKKVYYKCRRCGHHEASKYDWVFRSWKCPVCGNSAVYEKRGWGGIDSHNVYVKETDNGFFAFDYIASVTFPDEAKWYDTEPTIWVNLANACIYDRAVGVIVGEHPYSSYPDILNDSKTARDKIRNILSTKNDGAGVTDKRWNELSKEVRDLMTAKENAREEKKKARVAVKDARAHYQDYTIQPQHLYDKYPAQISKLYDNNATNRIYRVWCTNCGTHHDYREDQVAWNICPDCGAKHEGRHSGGSYIVFENTTLPENDLLIRLMRVDYSIVHGKLVKDVKEIQRVFLGDKLYVYAGTQKQKISDLDYRFNSSCAVMFQTDDEITKIIAKSCMEKTGLSETWGLVDGYEQICYMPNLKYIQCWYKYPAIELVAKANATWITTAKIEHPDSLREGKNVYEVLGVSKSVFKIAKQNHLTWEQMKHYQTLYKLDPSITIEKFNAVLRYELDIFRLSHIMREYDLSIDKVFSYLDSAYDHQCIRRREALSVWYDYLNMAKKVSIDLTQKNLMYPSSLKKEHDIAVFAYEALKTEMDCGHFTKVASENKAKYEYAYGDFIVKIPQTPNEIVEEASRQHNCLRSYIERVRDGETVVAFIRRKGLPDISYISVEIYDDKLVQVKAAWNKDPDDPKLDDFLNHWCAARKIDRNGL